ncbi:hypothetical protein ACYPKM_02740 [Pseudomonas aeruginosa]
MRSSHKSVAIGTAVTVALAAAFFAVDASAATSFSGQASQWKTQINAILGFAKLVFAMFGVFLFATGLFYVYKDQKEPDRGNLKTGLMTMFVGAGLMIIPWLIGMFTETIATGQGDDAQSRTQGSNV